MTEEELRGLIQECIHEQMSNYSPEEKLFFQNLSERKIWIVGEVDERMMFYINHIVKWNKEDEGKKKEDRKPIKIYLHNYGGEIDFMWPLIDIIEASETPVYTITIGVAASAASLIFMAGEKRIMTKRSKIMIHEGSAEMAGDAVKVMDATASYKKTLKQMKEYIMSRTTITQAALNKKRSNDWELDAQMCLDNNVCTQIVDSINDIL